MSITINTNTYPITRRFQIQTTATEIIFPRDVKKITIGSSGALNYSFEGNDGDIFGENDDIQHFSFVPANNMIEIRIETGRQSNRSIFIGQQSSTGFVSIVLEKF
jgi:hypothetical protein